MKWWIINGILWWLAADVLFVWYVTRREYNDYERR